ncbi:hypothetical protein M405DRAFT_812871 [Rhizopogon salebrosus TDB-379]|nr:hypothetical protein M405DRAFT_812871 [Rhizopogon salebrosus TDB-379]
MALIWLGTVVLVHLPRGVRQGEILALTTFFGLCYAVGVAVADIYLIVKIIGLVAGAPVAVTMFIWAVGVGSPHSYFLKEIFVVAAISRALRSGYDGEEQGNGNSPLVDPWDFKSVV